MTNSFTSSGMFGDLFRDSEIAAEFGKDVFVRRMLSFEAAWTRALGSCGEVSEIEANRALEVIDRFAQSGLGAGSNDDGVPVPALVRALRQDLPDDAARAIHTGATSQDVIDTAMVLSSLAVIDCLTKRLTRLHRAIDDLSERFGSEPLMARTRMQAALPASANLRIQAWQRPLVKHVKRVENLRDELATVQIGGAIGTRALPDALVEFVANDLGLSVGPVWHVDRSPMVSFGHWLTLVTGSLGKIGQDVALMAQQGVDEIVLSGGGGSSAMPHKQNPVQAEALVALARFVAGQQGILAQAMIHEQERSGTAWALEWMTLPAMAEASGAALNNALGLIAKIVRIGSPD